MADAVAGLLCNGFRFVLPMPGGYVLSTPDRWPPAEETREPAVDDGATASGHITVTEDRLFCRRDGVPAGVLPVAAAPPRLDSDVTEA